MRLQPAMPILLLLFALLIAGPHPAAATSVTYSLVPLSKGMPELKQRFNATQLELIGRLNRADLKHLARQPKIIVPDQWDRDALDYSPLPRDYAAAAPLPKLLVVDQPQQVFGAYEYGKLVRWGPVSTGRKTSPTPPGLYHLNWRSEGRHSTVNRDWFLRWYFNFDNRRGLSLHEYELPGLPESHKCVRLLSPDARWAYAWGAQWQVDPAASANGSLKIIQEGTPLLIVGAYDFNAPKPWLVVEQVGIPVELPSVLPDGAGEGSMAP